MNSFSPAEGLGEGKVLDTSALGSVRCFSAVAGAKSFLYMFANINTCANTRETTDIIHPKIAQEVAPEIIILVTELQETGFRPTGPLMC